MELWRSNSNVYHARLSATLNRAALVFAYSLIQARAVLYCGPRPVNGFTCAIHWRKMILLVTNTRNPKPTPLSEH